MAVRFPAQTKSGRRVHLTEKMQLELENAILRTELEISKAEEKLRSMNQSMNQSEHYDASAVTSRVQRSMNQSMNQSEHYDASAVTSRVQSPTSMQSATQSPMQSATQSPMQPATRSPVQPPVQPPVQLPVQPPAQPLVQPPGQPPVQLPVRQPPVQPLVRPHVQPPGQPPVQPLVQPHVQPPVQPVARAPMQTAATYPAYTTIYSSTPYSVGLQEESTLERLVTLLSDRQNKLPEMEPEIFSGDLLTFPTWLASFETLIEGNTKSPQDRLHYLGKYTAGEAKNCIRGFFTLNSVDTYDRAKHALITRYSDKYRLGEAFKKQLNEWPAIK